MAITIAPTSSIEPRPGDEHVGHCAPEARETPNLVRCIDKPTEHLNQLYESMNESGL
jgi:hypothetical protein